MKRWTKVDGGGTYATEGKDSFFNYGNRMVASTDLGLLQTSFDTLMGLYDRV